MSPTTALLVARDLAGAADQVRDHDPAVAARLDHDRELLLESADPLTVTATATLLGQSRQTIHDWLKRGILDTHPAGSKGKLLVNPRSVVGLLPFIDEWREAGGTKRALGIIIAHLEAVETAALLLKVIDQKKDTIRIYHLGGTMPRVERFGKEGPITTKDVMIV